jgi:hypothetical protein
MNEKEAKLKVSISYVTITIMCDAAVYANIRHCYMIVSFYRQTYFRRIRLYSFYCSFKHKRQVVSFSIAFSENKIETFGSHNLEELRSDNNSIKNACQHSPFRAKIRNSHVFFSSIIIIKNTPREKYLTDYTCFSRINDC